MTDPFLTTPELQRLTCRKRFKAQARMLEAMKIPFIVSGEGEPLVLRAGLYPKPVEVQPQPNFDHLKKGNTRG